MIDKAKLEEELKLVEETFNAKQKDINGLNEQRRQIDQRVGQLQVEQLELRGRGQALQKLLNEIDHQRERPEPTPTIPSEKKRAN